MIKEKGYKDMTNAEWIISTGRKFNDVKLKPWFTDETKKPGTFKGYLIAVDGRIIDRVLGYSNSGLALEFWLDNQHSEKILTDDEQKYLKAVIAPFRDRVERIAKSVPVSGEHGKIKIIYSGDDAPSYSCAFDLNEHFVGMEKSGNGRKPGKSYTLEELGL